MKFSVRESWALILLFMTQSPIVEALDKVVIDKTKTLDEVFIALTTALKAQPFNLDPSKIVRSRWEKLWTKSAGVKADKIDRTARSVAAVFADVIGGYDPPPCPDDATQKDLWTKLTT